MTTNRPASDAAIAVTGLAKRYGARTVFDDVSLTLPTATVTALTGPSGAGKTTLLRIIAGLDAADAGTVHIANALATNGADILVPPHARGIGMVFQQPALWPHMNVRDHVAFGLTGSGDHAKIVANLLDRLGLTHLGDAYPAALSGGEAARVALACALAPAPRCLLLDEPLAHLQPRLRRELAETLGGIARSTGTAVLIVTHSPDDLSGAADRLCHLEDGALCSVSTPPGR